ncbi:MAG: hypothetical protein AAFW87_11290 [Pseudomonadota bacterium]
MKQLVATLSVALALVAAPAFAQSVDMSSMTPVLIFPEPAPEPVTQDASGIDK